MTTPSSIALQAATACCRIRKLPRSLWKAELEAADPEIRECLAEYLRQAWREQQHRERVQAKHGGPVSADAIQKAKSVLGIGKSQGWIIEADPKDLP